MNSVAAHLLGLSWLNIELNFGNIGFWDEGQTGVQRKTRLLDSNPSSNPNW